MFKKNCLLGFVEVFFSLTICLLIQLDDFYLLFLGAYLCICTLTWCGRELALSPLLRRVSFLLSCCTVHSQPAGVHYKLAILSSPSLFIRVLELQMSLHLAFFLFVFNKLLGSNLSFPSPLSSTIRLCNLVGSCL